MPRMNGFTLKEVAQKVGVVSATIIRWIETGKVRVPKRKTIQGHYFFTEADLRKLLEYKDRLLAEGRLIAKDHLLAGDSTTEAPPPDVSKKKKRKGQ